MSIVALFSINECVFRLFNQIYLLCMIFHLINDDLKIIKHIKRYLTQIEIKFHYDDGAIYDA